MQKRVVLGRIVGAFGIGGWVKVQSFTDPADNILNYPAWQLDRRGEWQTRKHLEGRVTAKGVQVRIEGIDDRTEAEKWRGTDIAIERSELPPVTAGEFYWVDLLGLAVFAPNGAALGKVFEIRDTPAHPMLVIRSAVEPGKPPVEHWVPLVPERLKSVDLEGGRVVVDWSPDWLSPNSLSED
ncbi:MAG: 16S rRNA processing protein RimM [Candidatus Obscuribacterales bacterium]|nr:16S rRNA processing protein RimM [Steroidobacteraceae bacterium]